MKKKSHLKKLALLGITGGVILSSQADAKAHSALEISSVNPGSMIAASSCNGGSCGGKDDGKGGKGLYSSEFRTKLIGEKNRSGHSCGSSSGCAGMRAGNLESRTSTDTAEVESDTTPQATDGEFSDTTPKATNGEFSEGELMSQLNYKGRQTYQGLSSEGKALARQLAGRTCAGKNECKGLNSCKSDSNECAGKGSCKGLSKCSFKDKNQAVDVAAMKMAEKRTQLQNGN